MENEITIDLGRCFKALLKKWYLMLIVGALIGGALFLYKDSKVQQYTASSSIYSATYGGTYSENAQGIYTVQTFSSLIGSNKIAERAVSILGDNTITADYVRAIAAASYEEDSPILYIRTVDTNPDRAVAIANAVAQAFLIEAQNITGGENIRMLDEAQLAVAVSKGTTKFGVIGFAAGVLVIALIIVFMEIFSDRVYHVDDAELGGELEILGVIPDDKIS